jgi:hypothetical protein
MMNMCAPQRILTGCAQSATHPLRPPVRERIIAEELVSGVHKGETMATVALFHSVLGVRAGILDAQVRLRSVGHSVRVIDQCGGRHFDN